MSEDQIWRAEVKARAAGIMEGKGAKVAVNEARIAKLRGLNLMTADRFGPFGKLGKDEQASILTADNPEQAEIMLKGFVAKAKAERDREAKARISENLHRHNLDALEEARLVKALRLNS